MATELWLVAPKICHHHYEDSLNKIPVTLHKQFGKYAELSWTAARQAQHNPVRSCRLPHTRPIFLLFSIVMSHCTSGENSRHLGSWGYSVVNIFVVSSKKSALTQCT